MKKTKIECLYCGDIFSVYIHSNEAVAGIKCLKCKETKMLREVKTIDAYPELKSGENKLQESPDSGGGDGDGSDLYDDFLRYSD